MKFLFTRVFWGLVLILLGAGLFSERVYGINLPLWGIFWSLIIIWIGISLILPHDRWVGGREWRKNSKKGDVVFDERDIKGDEETGEYNIVFGRSEIDLSSMPAPTENRRVKVDTVFGSGVLIISKSIPIRIKATSAFGEVTMPNGNSISFGDAIYKTSSFDGSKPFIEFETSTVFGKLEITSR